MAFFISQCAICFIQRLISGIIYRIICLITWLPFSRILFSNVSYGLMPKFKMLMLNDACPWCFPICVVHYRYTLMILFFQPFCFKPQTSVFQSAQCIIKIFINRPSINDRMGALLPDLSILQKIHIDFRIDAFQQFFDKQIIPAYRNPLITVIEIIIVIGIPHRKTTNNKCRKLSAFSSPLFFCIPFNKFLIDICPHQTDSLIFQVPWGTGNYFSLFRNFFSSLLRSSDSPHFGKCIHIERKIINFPPIIRNWAVDVIVEFHKLIHIIPHFFIRSMKNMGTIDMNSDSLFFLTVYITT